MTIVHAVADGQVALN